MTINKKFLFIFIATSLFADNPDYESGKTNIINIMTHDETGISAYNKQNINYAETTNLSKDLNIPEIANFFPCKTEMGKNFIAQTLNVPVSSQDKKTILASRQNAIRTLVENPTLKKDIELLLEEAQKEETIIIELMSDFFKGKSCPELKGLKQIKEQNPKLYPLFNFLLKDDKGRSALLAFNLSALGATACTTGCYVKNHIRDGVFNRNIAGTTAYFAFLNGIQTYSLVKEYKNAYDKRLKIHSLNRLISIAEQVESLCNTNNIHNQFNISNLQNKTGINLIKAIKHRRYRFKNTFVFRTPTVQTFLYDLYEKQQYLAEAFACIAELDAYNALATQIIESAQSHNKFCFASYIEQNQPKIQSNNFWNILVKNAVPSSLSEDHHIILTGPNAGGKTTAIRAILQNIVLAQTFGIAAAESFECTMFDVIHSYLHISDDLINGLSLFASELKRAQEILEQIKQIKENQKFFFALDELFTGTAAEDGETCAYEFVNKMSSFKKTQFIYATHFERLKELAENNRFCKNYKVDAPTKDLEEKLLFPYTVSQGANTSRVAIDLAKQAGLFN